MSVPHWPSAFGASSFRFWFAASHSFLDEVPELFATDQLKQWIFFGKRKRLIVKNPTGDKYAASSLTASNHT